MSVDWYAVDAARERIGPMGAEELRRRFEAGGLQRRSLVWRDGMAQWQPLEDVAAELGIAFQTARASIPPTPPMPKPAIAVGRSSASATRASWILALVGFGLFAAVFVVGILAAIALPAYRDYTDRARLAEVMVAGSSMKAAVAEFVANTDRCPATFEELGLAAPAHPMIAATELGEIGPGQCSIRFLLGGTAARELDGESLWFVRDEDGLWACDGSMSGTLRPPVCRG